MRLHCVFTQIIGTHKFAVLFLLNGTRKDNRKERPASQGSLMPEREAEIASLRGSIGGLSSFRIESLFFISQNNRF